MRHIFLLFLLLLIIKVNAQLSDLHYLPPLKQAKAGVSIKEQSIYISTPEVAPFDVEVYRGTSVVPLATLTVSNASPIVYALSDSDNNITLVSDANTGVKLTNSGLRFESLNGEKFYVNYRGRSTYQATSLTSKGRQALGTKFKWGGIPNSAKPATEPRLSATLGIMATEDNTVVDIFGYDTNCTFRLGNDVDGIVASTTPTLSITLNKGESYVMECAKTTTSPVANNDGWIGTTIQSDKKIAISNGGLNIGVVSSSGNRDACIDQPVPENILGRDYVFVRGSGGNNIEFPIIIATEDNTEIYVGGLLETTINNGEYYTIPGDKYAPQSVGGNMYVNTSRPVYAYQCMAGSTSTATIGLNFIAPTNCLLPSVVNNIAFVEDVSGTLFSGGVTIIASTTTPDTNITVQDGNGVVALPASNSISGNPDWKTFYVPNLTGNISVNSTGPIAVGFVGFKSSAGIAGYFSGFDSVPEVDLNVDGGGCIPGAKVRVANANFDAYQWYRNGVSLGASATSNDYTPIQSGIYNVEVQKGTCTYVSGSIPVYNCAPEVGLYKTLVTAPDPILENDTVTFKVLVEQTGYTTVNGLVIEDILPAELEFVSATPSFGTWTAPNWTIGDMFRGQRHTIEIQAKVKEINETVPTKTVTNTVAVKAPSGVSITTDDKTEDITITNSEIALTKTDRVAADGSYNTVGEKIVYDFTVTNTGSTPLTNVSITDTNIDVGSLSPSTIASLAVGASANFIAEHTIVQADIEADEVVNSAIASAVLSNNFVISDISDDPDNPTTTNSDATVTFLDQEGGLVVEKLVKPASDGLYDTLGEVITYDIKVINTGNVSLNTVSVTDPNADVGSITPAVIANLPAGNEAIFSATHTIVSADQTAGSITNTATASGTEPVEGTVISDTSDNPITTTPNDPTVVSFPQFGRLEATKKDLPAPDGTYDTLGETITYTITVSSTGTVAVSDVTVIDAIADTITLDSTTGTDAGGDAIVDTMAPGTTATFTVTHAITQDDLDLGRVENSATVGGLDPGLGSIIDVTDDPDNTTTTTDDITVTLLNSSPSLVVTKVADDDSNVSEGQTITYTYTVTNNGNVTIDTVSINDVHNGTGTLGTLTLQSTTGEDADTSDNQIDTLPPNATGTWTATYVVTATDIIAQSVITNTVTVTGIPRTGTLVDPTANEDVTVIPIDTICSDTGLNHDLTADVDISGENFSWIAVDNPNVTGETLTASTATTITDVLVNSSSVVQTVTYNIQAFDSGNVLQDSYIYKVTINPKPSISGVAPTTSICSEDTLAYDLTTDINTTGTTFSWSATDNPNVTGETTTASTATSITDTLTSTSGVVETVIYTITPTSADGCVGALYTYTVTVNPKSSLTSVPSDTICSNEVFSHDLTQDVNSSSATFTWRAADNPNVTGETTTVATSTTIADTLVNISGATQTVTYTIEPTASSNCIEGSYTYKVIVKPKPFVTTSPTDKVCSGTLLAHNLSNDVNTAATTFSWRATDNPNVTGETLTATNTTSITDSLKNTSSTPQTVLYTIIPTSIDGCLGDTYTYTVTVNPEPKVTTAPTSTVCSGETLTHDLTTDINTTGTTFSWSAADNPNITGETLVTSATTSITDTLTSTSGVVETVTYTITPTSADGCIGASYTYTVTVNPEPLVTVPPTENVCSGVALNHDLVTDVNLSGITFSWRATENPNVTGETTTVSSANTITDVIINVSGVEQTVLYTITPIASTGCLGENYTYTVTVRPDAELVVSKTFLPAPDGKYNTLGEVIQYEITVENKNQIAMSNVSITDTNVDTGSITPTSVATLPANQSVTFTASHTITQADLNAGEVQNSATATGTDPCGKIITDISDDPNTTDPNDVTVTPLVQNPNISLEKTVTFNDENGDGVPQDGETLTYNFNVINTGNVTLTAITITDPLITVNGGPITLLSNTNDATTFFGTYTITQTNIDSGSLTNSATVSAKDPKGNTLTDISDDPNNTTNTDINNDGDPDDSTVFTFKIEPELTLTKTGVFIDANNDGLAQVGETIMYTFSLTNTGNITLENSSVSDPLVTVNGVAISLAPKQTDATTFTAVYTLNQTDVNVGNVTNIATGTGTVINDSLFVVSDDSDDPTTTTLNDATVTSLSRKPQLSLVKTAQFNDENGDGLPQVGETLTYTFDVKNTGNITVDNITVTDPLIPVTGGPISLNPGASDATTFIANYTITLADLDAGRVTNSATVSGIATDSSVVTDISDDPNDTTNIDTDGNGDPDDSTITLLQAAPQLSLEKSGIFNDENGDGIAQVGETIGYTFNVKNIGNVTVSNITINDPLVTVTGSPITLKPLETNTSAFVATYTLTQADLNAGRVINTATVSGITLNNSTVTDTSDDPTISTNNDPDGDGEPDDPTVTTLSALSRISLTKTDIPAPDGSYDTVGEDIIYELVVTNTGTVTLTSIVVEDTNANAGSITPALIPTLAPNQSVTVSAKHTITQAEIDTGTVINSATVSATDPYNFTVIDISDDPDDPTNNDTNGNGNPDDNTTTPINRKPSVQLEKVATFNDENNDGLPQVGETITYNFSVANTGNTSLTTISLTDPLISVNGGPIDLAVGATDTTTFFGVYVLTQADIDAGSVTNQAVVSAVSTGGNTVTDTSDDPKNTTDTDANGDGEPDDPTVTLLIASPELTLYKTGIFIDANNDGLAQAGETIAYTFDILNTGNVTVDAITVSDPLVTVNGGPISLAPQATDNTTFTATYILLQADVNNGNVVNTATVSGIHPKGGTVIDTSDDPTTSADNDATVTTLTRKPQLTLFKTDIFNDINGDGKPQEGETITYTFDVRNTGNVTINAISITDPKVTVTGSTITLDPAQKDTTTFSAVYTIQQSDIDDGLVTNIASVTGTYDNGGTSATTSDFSDDPDNPTNTDANGDGNPDDPTVSELISVPALNVLKTGIFNDLNGDGYANVGETITYNFTVENTGNASLIDVVVTDPLVSIIGSPINLAPSQVDNTTFSAVYTLTQNDLNKGSVTNSAVVSGKTLRGITIYDISDDPNNPADTDQNNDGNPDDNTIITFAVEGTIRLTKTALEALDGSYDELGEKIRYSMVVKNTGNVPLSDVKINDTNTDEGSISPASITLLNPGEEVVVVAAHTITQVDLDTGSVNNSAVVTAKNPLGNLVTDISDDPTDPTNNDTDSDGDPDDITITLLNRKPSIGLTKAIDNAPDGLWDTLGEAITYTMIATNTGNITLNDIIITDGNADSGSITPSNISQLLVGESITITAKHTITQTDLDTGGVTNKATIIAKGVNGQDIIDDSDDPNDPTNIDTNNDGDPDDPTVTNTPQLATLDVKKVADVNSYTNVGDILPYTITVTNTGNVTLLNLILKDANATFTSPSTLGSLKPGDTFVVTAEHVVTLDDITAGSVSNSVLVDATIINSRTTIREDSDDPNNLANVDKDNDGDPEDPTVVTFGGVSDLSITKEVDITNPAVESIVTFTITVTNKGSVAFTAIEVEDILPNGYEFIDAVASQGSYTQSTGIWSLDSLFNDDVHVLQIRAKVLSSGDYLNTATLVAFDGLDAVPDNNSASVTITPQCLVIYNEFSPNGDGVNDTFEISCIEQYPNNTIEVYNRWGNIVYKAKNYKNDWNGVSSGRVTINEKDKLLEGTYYYVLNLNNGSEPKKGWLYINR